MTRSVGDANDTPSGQHGAGDQPVNAVSQRASGAWYRWRRSRPFWGGLLVLLGGAEMLLSERAPLPVVIHVGMQGLAGYLVPAVLLLCGLMLWFYPVQRTFYSILAVLLALGSWITSNLGGFFVGMALGVVGGALAFAWTRGSDSRPPPQLDLQPPRGSSGGLDAILSSPQGDSRPVQPPASGRPSAGDDTEPLRDEPGLGQEATGGGSPEPWRAVPRRVPPGWPARAASPDRPRRRTGRMAPCLLATRLAGTRPSLGRLCQVKLS